MISTPNPQSKEKEDIKSQVRSIGILTFLIGYSGYVPGIKSENVFGESFGKTSGLSGNG